MVAPTVGGASRFRSLKPVPTENSLPFGGTDEQRPHPPLVPAGARLLPMHVRSWP